MLTGNWNPSCSEIVSELTFSTLEEVRTTLRSFCQKTGLHLFLTLHFQNVEVNDREKILKLTVAPESASFQVKWWFLCIPIDPDQVVLSKYERGKHFRFYYDCDETDFTLKVTISNSQVLPGKIVAYAIDRSALIFPYQRQISLWDHAPESFISPFSEDFVYVKSQSDETETRGFEGPFTLAFWVHDGEAQAPLMRGIVSLTENYVPSGRIKAYFTQWCAEHDFLDLIREPCMVLAFKARSPAEFLSIAREINESNLHLQFWRRNRKRDWEQTAWDISLVKSKEHDGILRPFLVKAFARETPLVDETERFMHGVSLALGARGSTRNHYPLVKSYKSLPFPLGIFLYGQQLPDSPLLEKLRPVVEVVYFGNLRLAGNRLTG